MLFEGFSLIELLVVLTITAILSALAIPAYDRYVIKAHVSGLLTVADAYKIKLIEDVITADFSNSSVYTLNTDVIDKITVQALESDAGKYVIEVVAKMRTAQQRGIGLLQPRDADAPLTLQLQGVHNGDLITWSCHVASVYNDYVPNNCKNNDLEHLPN